MVVQSSDFQEIMHLYLKLKRVKAFLDEIAEEFVDAKSVIMRHIEKGNDQKVMYQVIVEYESHEFNRLSQLDTTEEQKHSEDSEEGGLLSHA